MLSRSLRLMSFNVEIGMAKAKKLESGAVCMVFSEEEAEILYAISRNVGGHPATSGRWVMDNILHALHKERVTLIENLITKGMTMRILAKGSSFRGDNNGCPKDGSLDSDGEFYDY